MDNIIEVKNLCKNYKDFKLDNVSFSLERGYVMGFIGTNGAGKSTTIKAIMNLIKRNSGDIKLFGLDNIKDELQIKDKIGFVYDENFYCEELNIENMKALVKPFYSKWNEDTFKKYLKLFDLDPKKKIRKLSKGMKTKFSLAIALSHEAELIIMDEPTAGLDPVFRREILEILHDLIEDENKGIFFSTHITSDLEKIADYITFIENGKIVFSKSKEEIDDNYCMVRGNKGDIHRLDKSLLIGYKENAFGFEALTKKKRVVNELLGNSVIIEKASLEDIMVNYTREVRVR